MLHWLEANFAAIISVVLGLIVTFFLIRGISVMLRNRALRAQATYSD